MSELIKITLNGEEISVSKNLTILQVARQQKLEIPTFCFDDRLKPFASCFICVVEVKGARTLLPACSTMVTAGMEIETKSPQVIKTRKSAIDLMLSDHAGDCEPPCKLHCPAHTDVQGYVAHIANGEYEQATRLIKSKLALPIVCGTICPNPCEEQCRRGLVDQPIAIRALKRFAADYDLKHGPFLPDVADDSGKKISIVGGGPAGLAAAYYLRQRGHEVHIYEALPQLGGMVRYGIPRFRLPWEELNAEIKSIIDLGVNVHLNQRMGVDFSLKDLKENSDAVLIAIGAHASKSMQVVNENIEGVIGGIEFLRRVVLQEDVRPGKKVAVIGGGDVAMDCARVAKRLGTQVTLLYRRTQAEMPALEHEQNETMEEGVEFKFLTAPQEVIAGADGRAKYLRVIKMQLGEPDNSGRRRPVAVEGSQEDLEFDLIISAIGQDVDLSSLDSEEIKPDVTNWKTFVYDSKNMTTPMEGIFAAGDCAYGPNTVVQALAEGRTAALSIDMYLSGAKIEHREEYRISRGRLDELNSEDFAPRFKHHKREREVVLPAEVRLSDGGYNPISLKLQEAQAIAEASRCIECGCCSRYDCSLRKYATEYNSSEKTFAGEKRNYKIDTRHPLIRFEADKCINCGSCVRICSEYRGISALSFVNRGFKTHVAPNFGDPLQNTNCDSCGMCIDLCPTGAISVNHAKEAGPWENVQTISSCISCGLACPIKVSTVNGKVINVESLEGSPICSEGKFSFLLPKKLAPTGDMKLAKNIIKSSENLVVVVSPWLTVEETFAASQFCFENSGTLYYLEASNRSQSKYPYSKVPGVANVALLDRLGATVWDLDLDEDQPDCIVLIKTYLPERMSQHLEGIKIIALSNNPVGVKPMVAFNIADPLESCGAFLTSSGKLAFLNSNSGKENISIYRILAELGEMKEIENLEDIRLDLVEAVSELSPLIKSDRVRLEAVAMAPKLDKVVADSRELAFTQFLKNRDILKSFLNI